MADKVNRKDAILIADFQPYELADGVHLVPTQGNGLAVETDQASPEVDAADVAVTEPATTITTIATTTTLPDDDGLPEFAAELQSLGAQGFAATDPTDVIDTEDGVAVTISSSIRFEDEPLQADTIHARLAELGPVADGYDNDGSAIRFLTIEPFAETPAFSLHVGTTAIRPLASTDDLGEVEKFVEVAEADGLWMTRESTDSGLVFLERLDGLEADLSISAHQSHESNIVRASIRFS